LGVFEKDACQMLIRKKTVGAAAICDAAPRMTWVQFSSSSVNGVTPLKQLLSVAGLFAEFVYAGVEVIQGVEAYSCKFPGQVRPHKTANPEFGRYVASDHELRGGVVFIEKGGCRKELRGWENAIRTDITVSASQKFCTALPRYTAPLM
jgi:hypothetical protein